MINTLLSQVWGTVSRLKTLMVVVGLLYAASIGAGIVTGRLMPTAWPDNLAKEEQNKNEQIEKVFGRFREPVREGQWSAVLTASGLVFLLNLFGDFSQFTVLSILIVPASFLGLAGWMQGMSLAQIHGSSFFSVFLYLFMGSLEWITYPLATVAGLNVGLSALFPKRQATNFALARVQACVARCRKALSRQPHPRSAQYMRASKSNYLSFHRDNATGVLSKQSM